MYNFQFRCWFLKQNKPYAFNFFQGIFSDHTELVPNKLHSQVQTTDQLHNIFHSYVKHTCGERYEYISINTWFIFLRNCMKRHVGFSSETSFLWNALLDLWHHFSPWQDHTPFYFSQFRLSATLEIYRIRHKNISQFAVCLYMAQFFPWWFFRWCQQNKESSMQFWSSITFKISNTYNSSPF